MRLPTFKLVLPASLRALIEARAERDGLSVGEAIRRRLLHSIEESDFDPRIRAFQAIVGEMIVLIEGSTGCRIDRHPAATETLRQTIALWLELNWRAHSNAQFEEGDMDRGLNFVPGTNPTSIATAIVTLVTAGVAADVVRRSQGHDAPKGSVINALEWLQTSIAEAEEGQKHEAAEKSKRRRLRRSDSER
jgi:hypothetical protein